MKKEYKLVPIDISLSTGLTQGTHSVKFNLPTEYDTIEGVCATENLDGGVTSYSIGLRDDSLTIDVAPFHKDKWINTGGKPADMFHLMGQEITPNEISCLVKVNATTNQELSFQLLFNCSRIKNS